MSIEQNKTLVRHCIEEVFNKGNVTATDEFFAPSFAPPLQPGVTRDREGYKQFVAIFLNAFPDLHVTIDDMVAEGDKVVFRATNSGTHKGEFIGIAPTGNHVIWTEISIWRIEGGRIAEVWTEVDKLGHMQQLGAIPSPRHG
jgi:predicted ester cyclase